MAEGAYRGHIVALGDNEVKVFVGVGGVRPSVAATLAVAADLPALRAALDSRQEVLLLFEGGDTTKPVIVGFIQPPNAHPLNTQPQNSRPQSAACLNYPRSKSTSMDDA